MSRLVRRVLRLVRIAEFKRGAAALRRRALLDGWRMPIRQNGTMKISIIARQAGVAHGGVGAQGTPWSAWTSTRNS
jgi:hypothetical protein